MAIFGVQRAIVALLGLVVIVAQGGDSTAGAFQETATIRPLDDGRVLARFQFVVRDVVGATSFPRAMAQIMDEYAVNELRLSLTLGTWSHARWGYPLGEASAGSGAELWAHLQEQADSDVDARWLKLTNALAGQYCASLNFIEATRSAAPRLSFQASDARNGVSIRYGSLPRENVCTENLTPWIKQLPCQSKAGIATLLNTHRIYRSNYHSMLVHIKRNTDGTLEMQQTLISVLDPTEQNHEQNLAGWSLYAALERTLPQACPLASESRFVLQLLDYPDAAPTTSPSEFTADTYGKSAVYDLWQTHENTNPGFRWRLHGHTSESNTSSQLEQHSLATDQPARIRPILVHRRVTDNFSDQGKLVLSITNQAASDIEVVLFQLTPWYMKLFLHSLTIRNSVTSASNIQRQLFYQAAADRRRSAVLEMRLVLPSKSETQLELAFAESYLKYTEHPPDASRGFDIGPAVVTVVAAPAASTLVGERLYTTPFLLSLPIPDFSMPYNVITLTCTVVALFFGSMFNLLTRHFEPIRWRKIAKGL